MDEDTIKKEGIAPLMTILKEISDMFPAGPSHATPMVSKDFDELTETILFLAKLGVSALVSSGAGADDTDPDTVVVQVSSPWRIGLPAKDYYTDENVVKKYETALSELLSALYPNHQHENAHAVVEFEKKLAAVSPNAEDQQDVTVRP